MRVAEGDPISAAVFNALVAALEAAQRKIELIEVKQRELQQGNALWQRGRITAVHPVNNAQGDPTGASRYTVRVLGRPSAIGPMLPTFGRVVPVTDTETAIVLMSVGDEVSLVRFPVDESGETEWKLLVGEKLMFEQC